MSDLELSRTIREQGEGQLRSRQGKVVSIQTGPPRTITVTVSGQNIAGVRVMDHVDPTVNEGVWLLDMGNGRWLCYGTNSNSQTRGQFVKAAGDTMTGALTVTDVIGPAAGLTQAGAKITSLGSLPRFSMASAAVGTDANGSNGTLEVFQPTSGNDAFVTFHISGDFAAHFGLSGANNDLFVGGWSFGANKYKIFHEGNFAPVAFTQASAGSGSSNLTSGAWAGTWVAFGKWAIIRLNMSAGTATAAGRCQITLPTAFPANFAATQPVTCLIPGGGISFTSVGARAETSSKTITFSASAAGANFTAAQSATAIIIAVVEIA
jgi:hypothetical protein